MSEISYVSNKKETTNQLLICIALIINLPFEHIQHSFGNQETSKNVDK